MKTGKQSPFLGNSSSQTIREREPLVGDTFTRGRHGSWGIFLEVSLGPVGLRQTNIYR